MPSNAYFQDMSLRIEDNVYEPKEDSFLLAKAVQENAFGDFLDMGCGSGLQAIVAARSQRVKRVVAVDVSSAAIACAKKNAVASGVADKIVFKQSNLFSSLSGEKFDCISFNPPYLPASEEGTRDEFISTALEGGKNGRRETDLFLRQFAGYLKPRGVLLLLESSLSDKGESQQILESQGFSVQKIASKRFFFEEVFVLNAQRR